MNREERAARDNAVLQRDLKAAHQRIAHLEEELRTAIQDRDNWRKSHAALSARQERQPLTHVDAQAIVHHTMFGTPPGGGA